MPAARKDIPDTSHMPPGPERDRLRKRAWYLSKKADMREKREKANRAKGHKKREPDGPLAKPRRRVSKVRRYQLIGGLCYFNSELGFDLAELEVIARELRKERERVGMVVGGEKAGGKRQQAGVNETAGGSMAEMMEQFAQFQAFRKMMGA